MPHCTPKIHYLCFGPYCKLYGLLTVGGVPFWNFVIRVWSLKLWDGALLFEVWGLSLGFRYLDLGSRVFSRLEYAWGPWGSNHAVLPEIVVVSFSGNAKSFRTPRPKGSLTESLRTLACRVRDTARYKRIKKALSISVKATTALVGQNMPTKLP